MIVCMPAFAMVSKYFKEAEFKRCKPASSLQDMDQDFMSMLDSAREAAGIPFVLNSAYHSVEYEKKMGRNGRSAHTSGCAADIRCHSDSNRFNIIFALFQVGFTRIGIAKTYIHADNSKEHTQNVKWIY